MLATNAAIAACKVNYMDLKRALKEMTLNLI